jgi:hypothetical protein
VVSATDGFFREEDGLFHPLAPAVSGWGPAHVRGPAITGLLGRAAQEACPTEGHRPARASFELFRPARMMPTTTRATVVRTGGRLTLVDSELLPVETVVARAHVLFLAVSEEPAGQVWTPGRPVPPPGATDPTDEEGRSYLSGDTWTGSADEHHNDRPKSVWQLPLTVVEGSAPTPFEIVAAASDISSLVVHWGDRGVEFINADASITLARLPIDGGVGISATHRSSDAGVSVGSAVLFDRHGAFGTSSVVALANARSAVVPGRHLKNANAPGR